MEEEKPKEETGEKVAARRWRRRRKRSRRILGMGLRMCSSIFLGFLKGEVLHNVHKLFTNNNGNGYRDNYYM